MDLHTIGGAILIMDRVLYEVYLVAPYLFHYLKCINFFINWLSEL